jgi:hypothetical protein
VSSEPELIINSVSIVFHELMESLQGWHLLNFQWVIRQGDDISSGPLILHTGIQELFVYIIKLKLMDAKFQSLALNLGIPS